ncbi:hypothetical protein [Cupriavidus taiwanensis]|uniref:hypothetical protein n=1 Tax=Cupriavidus taiwanensis TaxID=164546 RepID=UPI000E16E01F|nr:hypothetical protein [Cupriavidus taiwanensis]SPA44622.1 conserved hypothetical protein [Cupriavidus taiwanensis]
MRRAAKVDDNQAEIVKALRQIGATVQPIHQIGKGCPDLLVGWRGMNTLLELKDGRKPPSARKLTQDEVDWHETWRGQVAVVETVEEAIAAVTN